MHSITEFEGNIPAFLAKLWNMVEEPNLDELIAWGANGLSFVIKDQNRFAKELLPMYYKHNNMASFIRQLNMYGFHKNISLESGCAKMEEVVIEFYHPCFQKNNPNLLQNIKRKINTGRGVAGAAGGGGGGGGSQPPSAVVNQVLHDVRRMKSRQDSVDSRLAQMKCENEALWREVAMLRQKHIQQQQIVNKVIQFLVSFVQPRANGITVKRRNIPLMLQDRSVHSNQLNKNNQSLSGLSEITRSPTGPVIHEIDPNEYAASLLLNDVRVDEGIASPQDASAMLADNPISQESVIDNDETLDANDAAVDSEVAATELLDLPDQLLAAADQLTTSADDRSADTEEQLFARRRPNQMRASKRRPRKPAATKKLSTLVADDESCRVADDESCPVADEQSVISGLVLDDFPLIIPGSQALEQLNNLPTADDTVTTPSPQTVNIEAVTSPIANLTSPQTVNIESVTSPIANLTAVDSPVPIVTNTSPYSASGDLTAFADVLPIDAATIVNSAPTIADSTVPIDNSTPTIVNSTVPIIAPAKTSRYKRIAPKLSMPEERSEKVMRPQRKRKSSTQSRAAGGKKSKSTAQGAGVKSRTVPVPVPQAAKQMPTENSDRTVACMTPTNPQQSIKYARNQEYNNTFFKPQEIDNHVDSMQNDLETLKELLKGESISLDANTLLGLFNAEDPFSLTMDLPTQMQTEDKSKEPDNNQLVSYTTPTASSQELGDLFGDWILSPEAGAATPLAADADDVYNIPELNTPDILMTPEPLPQQPPLNKRRKK
ncbi:hypothetical protein LSTR_LSTR004507 [Laodelphax striatellus]|uniref:HSF-type DNA-binding domain-containing protein n=1 Tax=Laodelphax striatellus TaxID=195883 RepID=A0A482XGL6_LAOST|nr:hypothetical protein LSTR_LSTR004507 [Laodelphax striatellus]